MQILDGRPLLRMAGNCLDYYQLVLCASQIIAIHTEIILKLLAETKSKIQYGRKLIDVLVAFLNMDFTFPA